MRIAAFLLWLLPAAHASSFLEAPFAESAGEAPVIVRGTVGKSEVQRVTLSDGSRPPFTYWDLKVSEVLKGDLKGGQIRIRQLGGERDGSGMSVSGAAEFAAGEDVVLMLENPASEDQSFPIRGLGTGKYAVVKEGAEEYLIGSGIGPDPKDPQGARRIPLKEVRKIVAKPPEPRPAPTLTPAGSGLLGDQATAASDLPAREAPPAAESAETVPSERGSMRSRIWVFLLGGAIGYAFYRRRTRR